MRQDAFLLIFNLPPPLARFWYRGGEKIWGKRGVPIFPDRVELGAFYRQVLPVIWDQVEREEYAGDLELYRLNDAQDHDPRNYYYVWEVVRQKNDYAFTGGRW